MAKKKPRRQFITLEYDLIHSEIYRSLSGSAVKVYCEIKASRNRKDKKGKVINTDDGHIEFGYSDVGGAVTKNTFVSAIEELRIKGLIQLVAPGGFPKKKAVYALSNKWRTYELTKKARQGEADGHEKSEITYQAQI